MFQQTTEDIVKAVKLAQEQASKVVVNVPELRKLVEWALFNSDTFDPSNHPEDGLIERAEKELMDLEKGIVHVNSPFPVPAIGDYSIGE